MVTIVIQLNPFLDPPGGSESWPIAVALNILKFFVYAKPCCGSLQPRIFMQPTSIQAFVSLHFVYIICICTD
ncbi:hypothetical protein Pse7367_1330 [Thalassoporum mexicanum PCC 7367]|nr:hypothetical protein Pse7367_1330 [Pseudanabaena sp. PCC 7367]